MPCGRETPDIQGYRQPFFQDLGDRAGAQSALHQASEAIIDLRRRAELDISGDDNVPDIAITDDVARADDHSECAFWPAGAPQAI